MMPGALTQRVRSVRGGAVVTAQLLKEKAAAVAELTKRGEIPSPAWALVINEKALDYTLEHCAQELMEVARACKAVVRRTRAATASCRALRADTC